MIDVHPIFRFQNDPLYGANLYIHFHDGECKGYTIDFCSKVNVLEFISSIRINNGLVNKELRSLVYNKQLFDILISELERCKSRAKVRLCRI